VARFLVWAGGANVEAVNNNGSTALHLAVGSGSLEMVQFLVETGRVNVEASTNKGWTLLHLACRMRRLNIWLKSVASR
jgi:ankyrin repeat protein